MTPHEKAVEALSRLSRVQFESLSLVARGMTIEKAAELLCRSPYTVKSHLADGYKLLGITKATQLAVIFTLAGVVTEWEAA